MQVFNCETECPLVGFCNGEIAKRREELQAIGNTVLAASESYSDTLQRYNDGQEHLKELLGEGTAEATTNPKIKQAAADLEARIPKFRENAAYWIDTKHRRIGSLLTFKEAAKSNCEGPRVGRKFILSGSRVTRCTAHYNRLHYLTLKAISHLPRNFPEDIDA